MSEHNKHKELNKLNKPYNPTNPINSSNLSREMRSVFHRDSMNQNNALRLTPCDLRLTFFNLFGSFRDLQRPAGFLPAKGYLNIS
jgi:hypothetical protein